MNTPHRPQFIIGRTLCAAFAGICLVSVAGAQTATRSAASATEAPVGLEEIVVTAQKREQNSQDIGISLSAITGADLEHARCRHRDGHHQVHAGGGADAAQRTVIVQPVDSRRHAERLRRSPGEPGGDLRRRRLRQPDGGPRVLAVRHRPRRGAARPAGHAVRPQRDRRSRKLHLAAPDRRGQRLRQRDHRRAQPGARRGCGQRPGVGRRRRPPRRSRPITTIRCSRTSRAAPPMPRTATTRRCAASCCSSCRTAGSCC